MHLSAKVWRRLRASSRLVAWGVWGGLGLALHPWLLVGHPAAPWRARQSGKCQPHLGLQWVLFGQFLLTEFIVLVDIILSHLSAIAIGIFLIPFFFLFIWYLSC